MEHCRARIARLLLGYFGSDNRRIEHALRVLFHAERLLPEHPGCDPDIVIASALLHDVGIRVAEERHGQSTAHMQELYGPDVAAELLSSMGFPEAKTEVVKQIIGNHHSPSRYEYPELALLKEADRIVNQGDVW